MAIPAIGIYFLYFALSTPDSYFCDLESRNASCTLQESQPVCAIYSGEDCHSPTGICERTLDSSCLACNDPSIISYVIGECQESKAPKECTDYDRNIACSPDKETVCGYASSFRFGREKVYSQEWENGCDACNPIHIKFHIPGECQDPDTLGICQKKYKETKCTNQGPSCAYYTGRDCTTKVCRETVQNACSVCEDTSVLFHIDGSCEASQFTLENTVEEIASKNDSDEVKEPTSELELVMEQDGAVLYQEIHKQDLDAQRRAPIPQLRTILLPDGSELIVREEPHCEVPVQKDIPLLEEVLQPDGSIIFERVERSNNKETQMDVEELESEEGDEQDTLKMIDSRLLVKDKDN